VRTFRSGISAFPACLWSPGVHTIHPYPNSPGPGNLTPLTLFRFADNICADTEFPSTSKFGSPRYGHGFKPGCTKESRSSFPAYHSQASTRCAGSGSYLSTSPKLSYVLLIRLQIDYNATRHDFGLHQGPRKIQLGSLRNSIAGISKQRFDSNTADQERRAAAAVVNIYLRRLPTLPKVSRRS
jgi:hypothetical protein